jgi:glucokinase
MAEVHVVDDRPASIVGINIGGTNTTVIGGLDDGTIVSRWAAPTVADDGQLLIESIVAAAHAVAPNARCAGVAVGGPMNVRDGIITEAVHLPGLHGVPLRDRLNEALELPVHVHHDAAACALAEWRWGPNAGVDGLAYLTCGTGFGTGLMINGRVRYAPDGRTPEIGHIRYRDEGPPIFGKPGCYEGYASANALALLLRWREPNLAAVVPAMVVDEVRQNNPDAIWALRENERAVGMACAMLADLLVLDVIVLGTLATYLGPAWVANVRAVFEEEALAVNASACAIRSAMPDVQDKSALAAALDAPMPARTETRPSRMTGLFRRHASE